MLKVDDYCLLAVYDILIKFEKGLVEAYDLRYTFHMFMILYLIPHPTKLFFSLVLTVVNLSWV